MNCKSIDGNRPYEVDRIKLEVLSNQSIELTFFQVGQSSPMVTEQYDLTGKIVSKGNFTGFLKSVVVNPHDDAYGEGPLTNFLIESSIFTTSKGIIATTGQQFSWAKYSCK